MLSTTDTLHSAEPRKVAIRMRPDLQIQRQQVQGRTVWNVKDPVALRYFQLTDEEYTVLRLLDGSVSLSDLKTRFEKATTEISTARSGKGIVPRQQRVNDKVCLREMDRSEAVKKWAPREYAKSPENTTMAQTGSAETN